MSNKTINKSYRTVLIVGGILTAVLSCTCFVINVWCGAVCLALGAALTGVFLVYTSKRLDELSDLNSYLSLVCSGKYELRAHENTEGELSILKNNLFKVVTLLKSQNEMLQKDRTYLADSLADISHQLKTPMTSMMVMSDLLKEEACTEKQSEFLGIMETQLDKMSWLITTLLKLSKLDADTADFKKEPFSAKRAIESSIKPFLVMLDLKNITVINDCEDFMINGSESWSVEAFTNIIKNCAEHTGKSGTITVSSHRTSVYDTITIKDNGTGIAKEDLAHVFERFYHGKNSSSDSVGIGLALSKAVFEKEKGKITVESSEGEGTTFEIKFFKTVV